MSASPEPRTRYIARVAIIAVSFLVLLLLTLWLLPNRAVYRSEFPAGDRAITRLEAYYQREKRYPETLESIDPEDARKVFYRKEGQDSYILWFGIALGESVTYDSRTRSWSD